MSDDILDPTVVPGAGHPRDTPRVFGHEGAEQTFLDAFQSDRLHHAWLITGPKGIGKATLAWRIARFLLATPMSDTASMFAQPMATSLDVAPDHPVVTRITAGSEAGLKSVHRTVNEKGRLRDMIVVDDIRALTSFFRLSVADGGRRVVIIDAADEMNPNAANAFLKVLEEPPARTTILLVCHQPSRLLPTIRSRCRTLPLKPLAGDAMSSALAQAGIQDDNPALAALCGGSVGLAVSLARQEGLALYAQIIALLGTLPQMDRSRALALADLVSQRGAGDKADMLYLLIELALTRLAHTGATATAPTPEATPNEGKVFLQLAPNPNAGRAWAETAQVLLARARQGRSVNLDPGALLLDTLQKIAQTAQTA